MTTLTLDDVFRRELPELTLDWKAVEQPAPRLLALNRGLARSLGLDVDELASDAGVALLAGNVVPEGASPVAMGYAGHQFGSYSPRLGDGRALLLGELRDQHGELRDLHLKGSGRTPFSRGGDGNAALGPMLREFVIAEAMHALGVPTGRALAVVATGQDIMRDSGPVPGAVLARVAASHIRVGTFEYAARLGQNGLVQRLVDVSIARHHPAAATAERPALALLEAVVVASADLVARWMLLGFVHGVMNTDNVTISGETIDYGPCAFIDAYSPEAVFSSIDRTGRYALGNQPAIMQWDLARLAETLLPLISDDADEAVEIATDVLRGFGSRYAERWLDGMRAKLGLTDAGVGDQQLADDLLDLMDAGGADWTSTFRALAEAARGDDASLRVVLASDGVERIAAVTAWLDRWRSRLDGRGGDSVAASMDAVNPVHIPRNHLVEEALDAATAGDVTPFHELLAVVTRPYEVGDADPRFALPAPAGFTDGFRTFCGT